MVAQVRVGASMRSVARLHHVSLSTVQLWVGRAGDLSLDRVDWSDRAPLPLHTQRSKPAVENRVLRLRRELKETSDLGEYGAKAIRRELVARGYRTAPSLRTIGRILERRGALDGGRRVRRNPPPRGWYLPEVAQGKAELDSFDIVEGLALAGGRRVEVLNVVSLHGGLPGAWPQPVVTAKTTVQALLQHWRQFGLPAYAQFDNDTIFQGSHSARDALGRVVRVCLQLGVTAVFAPPQESGFQAAIENFNGRWQAKVWTRFYHDSLLKVQQRSRRYIQAYRQRAAARIDDAPKRRPFPSPWRVNLQAHLRGVVIFLRRTSTHGTVSLVGRTFETQRLWPNRLVRCELDLRTDCIRFYALRRRDPNHQPLLKQTSYHFPRKPFRE